MDIDTERRRGFDSLFAREEDPWGYRWRWYELRKRQLVLAALPHARYGCAYEPGCAIGELSADLAARCDLLIASDGAATAVALAARRLAAFPQVQVMQSRTPQEWPGHRFDLVVLSEFAYYLSTQEIDSLCAKAAASLLPHGVVLACHWRRRIDGCDCDGDAVHRRLAAGLGLSLLASYVDEDLRLDVWGADARSVATLEGLVGAVEE